MLQKAENPKVKPSRSTGGPDAVRSNVARRPHRLQSVDHLALSIVHDLRNPLCAICGCAELLATGSLDAEQTSRIQSNIRRASEQMKNILTGIGSMAKRHRNTQVWNLREILTSSCEAAGVARRSDIAIVIDAPPEIGVRMDRQRMERVFVNLIANALEAMPHAGLICITACESGSRVRIAVEDSGPGIPAEIRSTLFEPFTTARKKDGIGLGLALARQAVRDHGGELWAEASQGGRFVMSLPRLQSSDRTR